MFKLTGTNQEILRDIKSYKDKILLITGPVWSEDLSPKKKDEIITAGRFLFKLNEAARVIHADESPDVIAQMNDEKFGLEIRVIRNEQDEAQQLVGSSENLIRKAEDEMKRKYPDDKIQVNVYLKHEFVEREDRARVIAEIVEYIHDFYHETRCPRPDSLDNIIILNDRNGPTLRYNPGGYAQPWLTEDVLRTAIADKNALCESYRRNSGLETQWLLLVIGETGPASFEINDLKISGKIESNFDRIYIYEVFNDSEPLRVH